ncbi:TPA: hypothetical protein EYP66_03960 [Candidatus Poribacteria bacterium]|nr:hypothetical protein [Candidatus Poribacteria bacterium]
MKLRKKFTTLKYGFFFLALSVSLSLKQAYAYIDPGTAGAIFSSLGPLLWGILVVSFGVLIWPFRRFFRYLNAKWNQQHKALAFVMSGIIVIVLLGLIAIVCIFLLF